MSFRNTWDEEVEPHEWRDCPTCGGSGFYKLPYGAPGDGREVEDENNCYCDCHSAPTSAPSSDEPASQKP